jgi:hypothetical protein
MKKTKRIVATVAASARCCLRLCGQQTARLADARSGNAGQTDRSDKPKQIRSIAERADELVDQGLMSEAEKQTLLAYLRNIAAAATRSTSR